MSRSRCPRHPQRRVEILRSGLRTHLGERSVVARAMRSSYMTRAPRYVGDRDGDLRVARWLRQHRGKRASCRVLQPPHARRRLDDTCAVAQPRLGVCTRSNRTRRTRQRGLGWRCPRLHHRHDGRRGSRPPRGRHGTHRPSRRRGSRPLDANGCTSTSTISYGRSTSRHADSHQRMRA